MKKPKDTIRSLKKQLALANAEYEKQRERAHFAEKGTYEVKCQLDAAQRQTRNLEEEIRNMQIGYQHTEKKLAHCHGRLHTFLQLLNITEPDRPTSNTDCQPPDSHRHPFVPPG